MLTLEQACTILRGTKPNAASVTATGNETNYSIALRLCWMCQTVINLNSGSTIISGCEPVRTERTTL